MNLRDFAKNNRGLLTTLATLAVVLLVYLIGPIRLCFVPSGSMEPNIPTWSLCVINARTPYEAIEVGDVVVYNRRSDNLRIIHRVIEITDGAMVTKGDANQVSDGPSVTPDNLYGKYLFHIPGVGRVLYLAKTPVGIAVSAVVIVALLLWLVADDRRERKRGRQEGK